MKYQPSASGCLLFVILFLLGFTVKFSRLPVLGLGENGFALGWLLIADGVLVMTGVAFARWFQPSQWQISPEPEQAYTDDGAGAGEEEAYDDGYVPRDVDAEWSAWFSALNEHFADSRRGETWPAPQVDFRWGGSPFGDLPVQPPRNPPPDDEPPFRPPSPGPAPLPPQDGKEVDEIEDWIDEQFERVYIKKGNKEA